MQLIFLQKIKKNNTKQWCRKYNAVFNQYQNVLISNKSGLHMALCLYKDLYVQTNFDRSAKVSLKITDIIQAVSHSTSLVE